MVLWVPPRAAHLWASHAESALTLPYPPRSTDVSWAVGTPRLSGGPAWPRGDSCSCFTPLKGTGVRDRVVRYLRRDAGPSPAPYPLQAHNAHPASWGPQQGAAQWQWGPRAPWRVLNTGRGAASAPTVGDRGRVTAPDTPFPEVHTGDTPEPGPPRRSCPDSFLCIQLVLRGETEARDS